MRNKVVREGPAEYKKRITGKSVSPQRKSSLEKAMPPQHHEGYVDQEIDTYNDFGALGWCYIYQEMLAKKQTE